jgi:ribose transport system permease protein
MIVALVFGTGGAGGGLALDPAWLALPVSLAMALAVGAAVGSLNGFLVVRFGINAFIVTLASFIWARGLVVALSGGRSVYGLPDAMRVMAVERVAGLPLLAWMLILVYLVFIFVLTQTPFGRHLTMIGGNPAATYRAGIRVGRTVAAAFILSGVLAGFAGWLLASRTAGATANLGIGMLFQAFAAVVIGGVSLKGGQGRLSGVFAGVLLLSSIQTAINVMGMPPHYTQMIQGSLVLAAVLLDTLKNTIRRRFL